jgi:hypothetical protein
MGPVSFHFLPSQKVGCRLQVRYAWLGFFESKGDQNLTLRNEAGPPEVACHFNLVEGDGFDVGLTNDREGNHEGKYRQEQMFHTFTITTKY